MDGPTTVVERMEKPLLSREFDYENKPKILEL
jgi:hypothetical protein